MKTWHVDVKITGYATAFVKAESKEEAWALAQDFDFADEGRLVEWEWEEVVGVEEAE